MLSNEKNMIYRSTLKEVKDENHVMKNLQKQNQWEDMR